MKALFFSALPSQFSRALQAKGVTTIEYKNDKAVYGIGYNCKGHTYRGVELDGKLSFENISKQLQLSPVREHQLKLSIGR